MEPIIQGAVELCSCPLDVLEALERNPAHPVILDRCQASLPCCRALMREAEARHHLHQILGAVVAGRPRAGKGEKQGVRLPAAARFRDSAGHLSAVAQSRFNLSQLAELFGASHRHLTRLFKKAFFLRHTMVVP